MVRLIPIIIELLLLLLSLSQDRMCGHYLAYANIPKLCHACSVTPEESGDSSHVCNFLCMDDFNEKCNEAMKVRFQKTMITMHPLWQ